MSCHEGDGKRDPQIVDTRAEGLVAVMLPSSFYDREAVTAACYRFTNRCAILMDDLGDGRIGVAFRSLSGDPDADLMGLALEFCNEAVDQQIRLDLDRRCGPLREAIFEHAFTRFAPVVKKKL